MYSDYSYMVKKQNYRDYNHFMANTSDIVGVDEKNINIVVSLTTYGCRIYDVYLTINSLFTQTLQPCRIVLWLSKDEFSDQNIPIILKQMQSRGLTIRYTDDIKSYKKLIPSLYEYSDVCIVTVDDDMIYPNNLIEGLFHQYLKTPEHIVFNLGQKITFDKKGKLQPYKLWIDKIDNSTASDLLMSIGVGGVLYPPDSFDSEVTNKDAFMRLAPYADDLWFKVMGLKKGTKYIQTSFRKNIDRGNFLDEFIPIKDEQTDKLSLYNVINDQNTVQFRNLMDEYGLWNKLK